MYQINIISEFTQFNNPIYVGSRENCIKFANFLSQYYNNDSTSVHIVNSELNYGSQQQYIQLCIDGSLKYNVVSFYNESYLKFLEDKFNVKMNPKKMSKFISKYSTCELYISYLDGMEN